MHGPQLAAERLHSGAQLVSISLLVLGSKVHVVCRVKVLREDENFVAFDFGCMRK